MLLHGDRCRLEQLGAKEQFAVFITVPIVPITCLEESVLNPAADSREIVKFLKYNEF